MPKQKKTTLIKLTKKEYSLLSKLKNLNKRLALTLEFNYQIDQYNRYLDAEPKRK